MPPSSPCCISEIFISSPRPPLCSLWRPGGSAPAARLSSITAQWRSAQASALCRPDAPHPSCRALRFTQRGPRHLVPATGLGAPSHLLPQVFAPCGHLEEWRFSLKAAGLKARAGTLKLQMCPHYVLSLSRCVTQCLSCPLSEPLLQDENANYVTAVLGQFTEVPDAV